MLLTRLLILDVDGVLTDGTKVYDKNHDVLSKRFMCKDFSAIKKIHSSWNKGCNDIWRFLES